MERRNNICLCIFYRLKGSTLQVMGVGIDIGDQWAIIGGTGHFTMAQGYINKKVHTKLGQANIIELDIYAIFWPAEVRTNIHRLASISK